MLHTDKITFIFLCKRKDNGLNYIIIKYNTMSAKKAIIKTEFLTTKRKNKRKHI